MLTRFAELGDVRVEKIAAHLPPRTLSTAELFAAVPGVDVAELVRLTGIERRHVATEGEATSDPVARQDIYTRAQLKIMDEALVVPTWGIQRNNAVEAKYQGMKRDIRTYIWFYDAWIEE